MPDFDPVMIQVIRQSISTYFGQLIIPTSNKQHVIMYFFSTNEGLHLETRKLDPGLSSTLPASNKHGVRRNHSEIPNAETELPKIQFPPSDTPSDSYVHIGKLRHLVKSYEDAKSKRFYGLSGIFGANRLGSSSKSWQIYQEIKDLIAAVDQLRTALSQGAQSLGFLHSFEPRENLEELQGYSPELENNTLVTHAKQQFAAIDQQCLQIIQELEKSNSQFHPALCQALEAIKIPNLQPTDGWNIYTMNLTLERCQWLRRS